MTEKKDRAKAGLAREGVARGRPTLITRARIAEAGISIGLTDLTFTGVAAKLGVSHMGLYKHVAGLAELKSLIAEEMFLRWQLPPAMEARDQPLEAYLWHFAESIWALVAAHPGIAPYLLRGDLITPAMTDKIARSQAHMAEVCQLSFAQSRWLMLTLAFHCVAIADTVLPAKAQSAAVDAADDPAVEKTGPAPDDRSASPIDPEHQDGIRALIVGALAILKDITRAPYDPRH